MSQSAEVVITRMLHAELERIRLRSPGYSMRAFARRIGILPSTLSGILNGQKRVTRKSGRLILSCIGRDPQEIESLVSRLKQRTDQGGAHGVASPSKGEVYQAAIIDMSRFFLVSEWYCLAVLSLSATEGFKSDPQWIAQRLGITTTQAKTSIERLLELGLLSRSKGGRLRPSQSQAKTSDGIPDVYIRRHHVQGLDLARQAMTDEGDFESCDFSSVTMAIDPEKIPEAKRRISQFRKELCMFLESGKKKRVYRACFQLFPLSRA